MPTPNIAVLEQKNQELLALNHGLQLRIQEQTLQLQAVQELNHRIITSMNEGMIVWDLDLRYQVWNPFMEELSGYTASEVIGHYCLDIFPFLRECGLLALLERALAGESVCSPDMFFNVPETGKSGWSSESFTPLRDSEGKVIGVLGRVQNITTRKQAELALRESEEQNQAILSAIPDLMMIVNADSQYLRLSHNKSLGSINLLNHNPIGLYICDVLPPESTQQWLAAISQVLSTGQMQTFEQHVHIGDLDCYEEVRIVSYQEDKVLCLVQDISDRKQREAEQKATEEALRQSEATKNAIIESIPDLLIRIDHDGNYQELIHSRYLNVLLPDELPSKMTVYDVLPPEQAERRIYYTRLAIDTGFMQMYDQVLEIKGQTCYEEVRIAPLFDREALVIIRDISDRQLIEAERKEAEQALQRSEEQLRLALEFGNIAICDWDITSGKLVLNDFAYQLLGISLEVAEPTYDTWLEVVHPDDRAMAHQELVCALTEKRDFALEYRVVWADGTQRWIADRGRGIEDTEGNLVRSIAIMLDITDRKRTELAFRKLVAGTASTSDEDFFVHLTQSLVEALGVAHAIITEFCEGQFHTLAFWSNGDFVPNMTYSPDEATACARVIAWGEYQCLQDVQQEHDGSPFLEALQADSYIGVALKNQMGQHIGHLCIINSQPITNPEWFHSILDIFAARAAVELQRQNAQIALEQLNEDLEQRVQQRTQELVRSEQDLRTILNNVYDAIFIHDLDGTILKFNKRALELYDALPEQLQNATIYDLSPSDAALDETYRILQRANDGETVRFEWKDRRWQDNSTFDVEVSLQRVTLGNRPVLLSGVRDISDRKQAEQALLEAQQFAQSIADSSPAMLYIYDLTEQSNRYSNRSIWEVLGYTGEQIRAMGSNVLSTLLHPEDVPAVVRHQKQILLANDTDVLEIEYRMRHANGEWQWLYSTDRVFKRAPDGQVIQYVGAAQNISDRKATESKLQEQEQFLRSIYEGVNQPIFVLDVLSDNTILQAGVNPIAEKIIGKKGQETIGKPLTAIFEATQATEILDRCYQCITSKESLTFEEPIFVQGRYLWVITTYNPLINQEGRVHRIVGTVYDISDRKQVEAALVESEAKYRHLVEGANHLIYRVDLDRKFMYLSPQFTTIWGYDVAAFLGQSFVTLVHPEDLPLVIASNQRLLETGNPETGLEFRTLRHDGSWLWILCSNSPIKSSEGQVIGLQGVAQDITERKRLEADRQRAEQALHESEEKFRLAAEAAEIGVWDWNLVTDVEVWSRKVHDLFGFSPGSFNGSIEALYNRIHPDDRKMVRQRHQQAQKTGTYQAEFRVLYPNETVRWLGSRGKVMFDLDGKPLRMLGVSVDISDRKFTEQGLRLINAELEQRVQARTFELQKAMEVAEAASRAKSIFLANMSHELRTPLNAILGFSQLLNRDESLSPQQQQQVSIINRSGGHLLSVINDILEVSKLEAGRVVLNLSAFDLLYLLKDLEEVFHLQASQKGLQLTIQSESTVPQFIHADEGKLRQVLTNLLHNAIKFTQRGQITLKVQRIDESTNLLVDYNPLQSIILGFQVIDTGPGIDAIEQADLFKPFVQTTVGQQSQQGTGLGLSISHQFVQLMGGNLIVQSSLGQGSTFSFQIPVTLVKANDFPSPVLNRKVVELAPEQMHYRILVAEDHLENRQFLVQLLQSVGFDVQQVENGQNAIQRCQQWQPHLILMDIRMSVMGSDEAIQQIRALASLTTMPKIIALTANPLESEIARIMAAGCDDWISKPVTEALLFEKMAVHLGVIYIYEEQSGQIKSNLSDQQGDPDQSLTILKEMPRAWVDRLEWAASIADQELLLELLGQLPPEQGTLAQVLRAIVNDLRLDKLIELVREAKIS